VENNDTAVDLVRQFDEKVRPARLEHEKRWQEIAEFLIPDRSILMQDNGYVDVGKKTHNRVFDGTAIHAALMCANGVAGYMCSPSYRWIKLLMSPPELNQSAAVKKFLQDTEEQLYYDLQQSDFYSAVHQFILDGVSISTATMFIEDDLGRRRMRFMVRHPYEIFVVSNAWGEVEMVFRWYYSTARNVEGEFGYENLTPRLKDLCKKNPHERVELLHVTYPTRERSIAKLGVNKPITSVFIDKTDRKILSQGGFDENPNIVWRWSLASGEDYGRGPGSNAIKDVMVLNEVARTGLITRQKHAMPPMDIPLERRGRVNLNPDGRNYYEDATRKVENILKGYAPVPTVDVEQRLQAIIKEHFFVDFFLMLANAQRIMTATEIIEKQGEKAAVLSAITGRFGTEGLDRIIHRALAIGVRAGRMPAPPDELLEYAGTRGKVDYQIQYLGPLAQAQRRLFKVQGIVRSLESLVPIFQIAPDSIDRFDWDEVVEEIADSNGMPERLMRSDEELAKIRQAKQMQQQQMQQLAQLEAMAKAMPGLSKAPEANSPVDAMIAAGQGNVAQ